MDERIKKFLELERKKDEYKSYIKQLEDSINELAELVGPGGYFQDPTDGTVFKIEETTGKYVHFSRYTYSRTKRAGEKRGDLSMKEAREAGFKVGDE